MNTKLFLSACIFGLFAVAGCVYNSPYEEGPVCTGPDCAANTYSGQTVAQTTAPSPCDSNYLDAACQEQFVNYTKVAADYRAYGERTPRDQRVSQAAAGNNMTAVIPPSIENEVISYEETVGPSSGNIEEELAAAEAAAAKAAADEAEQHSSDTIDNMSDDQVEDWMAEEGQNLKALLIDWSDRAGWRLVWDTNRNYTLTAGAMFRGTFADVSSALIRAFARAKPAPVATFYKGNRVLVVETMEDENAYD